MLLVLTILQGHHFPKIASGQLIVQARFDGELMTTDPVEHTSDPNFNTDLAWEVDRRGLHHLKIARTPIKIQCFAIDKKNGKSAVGYIILDLRMAQFHSMKPKWYPILNSKYSSKPELLLTLGLEEDDGQLPAVAAKEQPLKIPVNLPTKQPTLKVPAPKFDFDVDELKPSLDSEEGYYQIGPPDKCAELFTFSVTIGFAANLQQLIPATVRLPSDHRGFFFYYSLLGNDIITDYFPDLAQAEFAAERASIKVRSSIPALRAFFYHQSGMQVHICCGEMSLGWAEVPLMDLLKQNSTDIFMQPVTLENSYELKTSRQSQMSANEIPDMLKPIVGIVLMLKREDQLTSRIDPVGLIAANKASTSRVKGSSAEQSPPTSKRPCPQTPPQKLTRNIETEQLNPVPMIDLSSSSSDAEMLPKMRLIDGSQKPPQDPVDESSDPSPMYKYSLTIDLRSIRNHNIIQPFKCFLRYSYPHFGNMMPIQTHPAVEVLKGTLVFLPNGSTVVKFTSTPRLLDSNFRQCPLIVDVIHQGNVTLEESLIGQAVLSLSNLIDQQKLASVDDRGHTIWKRSLSQTVPVINKSNHHVADLHTALVLEDLGINEASPVHRVAPAKANLDRQNAKPASTSISKPQVLEDSLAEKVAYELEQWKEWQEAIFLKQLKEREDRHMEAITAEWAQRETEREILLKKKLTEYQTLEDALKPALSNVEKREQELRMKEAELQRMKTDLQAEYDRHVQEVKDASRRLKEECAHRIELEKSNNKVLQDQCAKLRKELSEIQRKFELKDAEFQSYKDKRTQPEFKLQSELKLQSLEKAELERKIDALTKSKVHYKQQYARCFKELARLKQGMQAETVMQLRKQQQELEHMRLQVLATEQQKNLREPREDLEELKLELKSMAQTMEANAVKQRDNDLRAAASAPVSSEMPTRTNYVGIDSSIVNKIHESCLAHLVEEKETLLKTGMYPLDDPVIMELDKQIKALVLNMKR